MALLEAFCSSAELKCGNLGTMDSLPIERTLVSGKMDPMDLEYWKCQYLGEHGLFQLDCTFEPVPVLRPRDFPHSPRTPPNPDTHPGQTREPPDEDPIKQWARGTANADDEEETRYRLPWWLRCRAAQGPTPRFGDERNMATGQALPGAQGEPDRICA
ncbi:UNVERIFIED_CONTAM: hypothetical protein K2H54_056505 [Gekko kuhli]